jgi:hypothetical protein
MHWREYFKRAKGSEGREVRKDGRVIKERRGPRSLTTPVLSMVVYAVTLTAFVGIGQAR